MMRSRMRLLVVLPPDSLSLHTLNTASPWQGSLRLMSDALSVWMTLVISSRLSVAPPCCTVYVLLRLMLQCLRAPVGVRLGAALDCAALVAFVPSVMPLPLLLLLLPLPLMPLLPLLLLSLLLLLLLGLLLLLLRLLLLLPLCAISARILMRGT